MRGAALARMAAAGPPAVTAVTGSRRAGKSVLLRQFAASLHDERQVVYLDKESTETAASVSSACA